jgi:hypothetical protein
MPKGLEGRPAVSELCNFWQMYGVEKVHISFMAVDSGRSIKRRMKAKSWLDASIPSF